MEKKQGRMIGNGGCAEVLEWGEDQVLKLFRANTTRHAIEREYAKSLAVWKLGLPVPKPYEMLEVTGRPGIVYERIVGPTFAELFFQSTPAVLLAGESGESGGSLTDMASLIRLTAQLLFRVHQCTVPGLSSQKDDLIWHINRPPYLTDDEKARLCQRVSRMSSRQQLCHGDPNPGNFMLGGDQPMIIDWMNASSGQPEADLAEYIIMIRYAVLPPEIPGWYAAVFDEARETIIRCFMEEYTRLSGITEADVQPWIAPAAARKLTADAISEAEKELLVRYIRHELTGSL